MQCGRANSIIGIALFTREIRKLWTPRMANLRCKLNQTANTIRKVFKVLHVHTPLVLTKKTVAQ